MLTDYHLHLQPDGVAARADQAGRWEAVGGPWSPDWIGRYSARARARGVQEIAVTEHVHRFAVARDWHPNPWWREEATEDVDAYCAALERARAEGLPVLIGVEMDWLPDRRDAIADFIGARPFDIVLGSVHWLRERAVDHPDYLAWDTLDGEEIWERYLDELVAAARSGLFDVLAHIDLPKVFGHVPPASARTRWPEVLAQIAQTGVAVECSTAGLRKPVRELYPDPDLLGLCATAGIPATLSSDAHRPEDVAADYPTAVAALGGAGYTHLTRFAGRVATQVPIAEWA
jgi:histidinol-phosphatase (PHP family)